MAPDTTIVHITPAHAVEGWYEQFLDRFLAWASQEEAISAVIQVGSRARQDHSADRWADLDLMLYLTAPTLYLEQRDWLDALAPVWLALPASTAGNDPELLVMFEGGLNVDFVFCHVNALNWLREHAADDPVFRRGARVLWDREGRTSGVVPPTVAPPRAVPPTPEAFARACDTFWYLAVYLARQIRRGDLWLAQIRDVTLKEMLLQMITWHAGVQSGWRADTWHNGRFITRWADPRVQPHLNKLFGGYEARTAAQALRASIDLFRWLARETAEALTYPYPLKTDARCSALVADALGQL